MYSDESEYFKESARSYAAKKEEIKYTYGDYLKWPDDERWEIIEGVAYNMSPAPTRAHQEIIMELSRQISNYLFGKPCRVYAAPFDVRLPENSEKDDKIKTVVQPDIVVIRDRKKLDEKGCKGAPDLIVEIVSPSTGSKDKIQKMNLYEKAGVKEYWIASPDDKTLMVFKLGNDGRYGRPDVYSKEHKVDVGIFAGELVVDLGEVFTVDGLWVL